MTNPEGLFRVTHSHRHFPLVKTVACRDKCKKCSCYVLSAVPRAPKAVSAPKMPKYSFSSSPFGKIFSEKVLENNFGSQQPATVALSKCCIIFLPIILAREELLINVLEHTGAATDDRLEGEKLKAIRKQLFLNHPLTLSSHCVAYLSIFPYTLPSLIFPLFVQSILNHVSKCALYEALRASALWLIKFPIKTDCYCSYFVQQIHFAAFICAELVGGTARWTGRRHPPLWHNKNFL